MDAVWTLLTPPRAVGAIAMLQISGDVDGALRACGIAPVAVGQAALRNLLGVDTGVVARFVPGSVLLMPHGGLAVVRALEHSLTRAGIPRDEHPDQRVLYPEARSEVEARALLALSRAASPRAVDLLLAQHERWERAGAGAGGAPTDPNVDAALNHLIDPPLVVALGRPNIGKSALVNALARRDVSIVADEEGTTRDHVGVRLTLDGLVVNYLDTPGLRSEVGAGDPLPDPIESQAQEIALRAASSADLLLLCGDATHEPPQLPENLSGLPSLHVALRGDLGRPAWTADTHTSARAGTGLDALALRVREALVPQSALAWAGAWRFWPDGDTAARAARD